MVSKQVFAHGLAPVLITVFAVIAAAIWLTRPEPARRPPPKPAPIVIDVRQITPESIQIELSSFGRVAARVRSPVVTRVSGVVEFVSDKFREGASFDQGDVLLRLDTADYEIELANAQAQVAEAKSRLISEQALAAEARATWETSGRRSDPPPLAVREPQVTAAEAALKSAEAGAQRAALNLERTRIVAPFPGRVLQQNADLGQFVSPNTRVGEIFDWRSAEIKLPIEARWLAYVNFSDSTSENGSHVLLSDPELPGAQWQAHLLRATASLDPTTQQPAVIAEIQTRKSQAETPALTLGQYLNARILGRRLDDVIAIPQSALYQGNYVYVFEDDTVRRRDVETRWQSEQQAIIASGLRAGDQLVLTPLGQLPSGTPARLRKESGEATQGARAQR